MLNDIKRARLYLENKLGYKRTPDQIKWTEWVFDEKSKIKLLGTYKYGENEFNVFIKMFEAVIIFGIIEQLLKNPKLTFVIMPHNSSKSQDIMVTLGNLMQDIGFKGKFHKTEILLDVNINSYNPNPTVAFLKAKGYGLNGRHVDFLIDVHPFRLKDNRSKSNQDIILRIYNLARMSTKYYISIVENMEQNHLINYIKKFPDIKNNSDILLEV